MWNGMRHTPNPCEAGEKRVGKAAAGENKQSIVHVSLD
jgi:hypothetical protein